MANLTPDRCEALTPEDGSIKRIALPRNDTAAGCEYPSRMCFALTKKDRHSYRPDSVYLLTAPTNTLVLNID